MIEFIVFCIPSVVYVIVQSRGQGQDVESSLQRVGATWGSPSGYRWALVLLLPILLTGWLAITVIPAEILDDPGVTVGRITSVGAAVGVVARAVGEEVFFRGLLGGGESASGGSIHRAAPRACPDRRPHLADHSGPVRCGLAVRMAAIQDGNVRARRRTSLRHQHRRRTRRRLAGRGAHRASGATRLGWSAVRGIRTTRAIRA